MSKLTFSIKIPLKNTKKYYFYVESYCLFFPIIYDSFRTRHRIASSNTRMRKLKNPSILKTGIQAPYKLERPPTNFEFAAPDTFPAPLFIASFCRNHKGHQSNRTVLCPTRFSFFLSFLTQWNGRQVDKLNWDISFK